MLRSCGYEPEQLNNREKWLLLARMLPLVENNFNLCELGPRSTGKSHIYKEISPNSSICLIDTGMERNSKGLLLLSVLNRKRKPPDPDQKERWQPFD